MFNFVKQSTLKLKQSTPLASINHRAFNFSFRSRVTPTQNINQLNSLYQHNHRFDKLTQTDNSNEESGYRKTGMHHTWAAGAAAAVLLTMAS